MGIPRRALLFLGVLAVLAAAGPGARALEGPWDANEHVEVRLVSAADGVGGASEIRAGLEFRMAPGWKIYWRSPGDAGYPPRVDWSGSENLVEAAMRWPAPERFEVLEMQTLGYRDRVILPLDVLVVRPDRDLALRGTVDYLTCDDICIPYTATVSLDLPAAGGALGPQGQAIDRFRARVPGAGAAAGLSIERAALSGEDDALRLDVAVTSETRLGAPDLFVEGHADLWFGKPTVRRAGDGRGAVLRLTGGGVDAETALAAPLTFTLVDGPRAMEAALTPEVGRLDAPGDGWAALAAMLGLALLGGLILNLMPCVLPVLSLKLVSVLGHGGHDRAAIRRGFLASAAGILSAFLILAAGLIALKASGAAIGWGIQFQQPAFLAFMVAVMMLFAYNLWGLFEIRLPGGLGDAAAGIGAGPGLGGHFLTGMAATVMATPCSAPFLGTAVGFALARGTGEILAIFAALGVGLALPYLAVAVWPGLAARLPRPGPWMAWLKRILGLALAGTAVWLLSIVAVQAGAETALVLGLFAAIMGGFLLARKVPGSRLGGKAPLLVTLTVALMVAYPIVEPAAVPGAGPAPSASAPAGADVTWAAFDRAAIDTAVADGKTVFVDVTADWCITCQFNKVRVMQADPVAGWLARPDVVAMRADWTNPDPAIAAYLESFGRYGIPFNAVYGPEAPFGLPLPELLSAEAVFDAARSAGGGPVLAEKR